MHVAMWLLLLCSIVLGLPHDPSVVHGDGGVSHAEANPSKQAVIDPRKGNIPWMDAQEQDEIQVFYMEHVLAAWVLESAPWTAFHSGLGFKNMRTGRKFTVDYIPVRINSVNYVLVPRFHPRHKSDTLLDKLQNWWTGDVDFEWLNDGSVMFYNGWPSKYENFTKLGSINGLQYTRYMEWAQEYNYTHTTFDPVEIIVEGSDPNNETRRITKERVSSRMCHDLVSDSLWFLYEAFGVTFKPDAPVYRDHIMLFSEAYREVDISIPEERDEVISYFKLFYEFLPLIEKEFTNIRGMLVNSEAGGLEPFLYIGEKYYKVKLRDPFVNYCYMPMPMPPVKPNFFEDPSFCALENKLSSNATRTFLQATTEAVRLSLKLGIYNPSRAAPFVGVAIFTVLLLRTLLMARLSSDQKNKTA